MRAPINNIKIYTPRVRDTSLRGIKKEKNTFENREKNKNEQQQQQR